MASPCALLSAAIALSHGPKVHGRIRNARQPTARHHPRSSYREPQEPKRDTLCRAHPALATAWYQEQRQWAAAAEHRLHAEQSIAGGRFDPGVLGLDCAGTLTSVRQSTCLRTLSLQEIMSHQYPI